MFDQMGNMRKNVYITYNGETKALSEWCRIFNVKHSNSIRLKHGYSVEEAFETPIGKYERTNKYCKNKQLNNLAIEIVERLSLFICINQNSQ